MYAVGRLGSYITRGVYTVSGPFHPFGGAVDIVVVEQQDGSFKTSPWYIRFGKFQGVLKAKEKVVNISVNGVQADFHMYLDHKGEAYFLREADGEEGDSVFSPPSSGEEMDEKSGNRRSMKSKICNYDANQSNSVTQIDVTNGKIVTRKSSRRSRILGYVFGRKSMKVDSSRDEEAGPGVVRADSLERAELAADLLEVKWSTNLAFSRHRKENAPLFFHSKIPGGEAGKDLPINGHGEMDSPLHDKMVNRLDHPVLQENFIMNNNEMGDVSRFGFQKQGSSDKDFGVEMSCLNSEHKTETSTLGESGLQENYDLNSQTVREIDELGLTNADHAENAKGFVSETISPDPDSAELNACPSKKLDEEPVFKEDIVLLGNGISEEGRGADRREAFVFCETSVSSREGLADSGGKTDEALYISCRGCPEICVQDKILHQTAELISEVTSIQENNLLVAKEPLDVPEILAGGNCGNFFNEAQILGSEGTSSKSITNSIVRETYTQMVTVDHINGSVKEAELCTICTISGLNNSIYQKQDEVNARNEDYMSKLQHFSKPVGDSQEFRGDSVSKEAITVSLLSEGSMEEQLLFGDLDDFNHEDVKRMESISSAHVEKENSPLLTPKGSEAVIESLNPNDESHSSPDKFVLGNMPNEVEDFRHKLRIVSSHINVPRSSKVASEDVERMAKSLPNMWSCHNDLVVEDLRHSNFESAKWTPLMGDSSSFIKSDADKDLVSEAQPTAVNAQISEELKHVSASPAVGKLSEAIEVSNGSWRGWPFSSKRSRSMETTQPAQNSTRSSDAENTLESSTAMDGEKPVLKPKVKKKQRAITPTPEQLASLNLREGKNTVTFTFSTAMLGPQQVDARIYLWKWDTRVVISDVDGTITKSDVLGQFMPLVGVDWSQTGVAHLFSAIKENGFHVLFLSARAISQAYHTRQFLFNLKQDGKALPDGPVVISPDGLLPSLFREVIRRAPHEFKIACLEDIRALFPSDRNPFYAGFGNRDTDEVSYLKVGIPKGKIFIINPKGEVVVNHRVDKKSYTSLHTLVHDMFPPISSSEQEDFNSWNYWKLPPPAIDF